MDVGSRQLRSSSRSGAVKLQLRDVAALEVHGTPVDRFKLALLVVQSRGDTAVLCEHLAWLRGNHRDLWVISEVS